MWPKEVLKWEKVGRFGAQVHGQGSGGTLVSACVGGTCVGARAWVRERAAWVRACTCVGDGGGAACERGQVRGPAWVCVGGWGVVPRVWALHDGRQKWLITFWTFSEQVPPPSEISAVFSSLFLLFSISSSPSPAFKLRGGERCQGKGILIMGKGRQADLSLKHDVATWKPHDLGLIT